MLQVATTWQSGSFRNSPVFEGPCMPQPTTPMVMRSEGAARPEDRMAGAAMTAAPVVAMKRRRFMPAAAEDETEAVFCFIVCLSIHLAEVRRQNVQFGSIFGNCAPGDDDAFVLQHLHHFLIGQRFGGIFFLENIGDHVFHARVRQAVTGGRLNDGGKEILHFEQNLWSLDVFA